MVPQSGFLSHPGHLTLHFAVSEALARMMNLTKTYKAGGVGGGGKSYKADGRDSTVYFSS